MPRDPPASRRPAEKRCRREAPGCSPLYWKARSAARGWEADYGLGLRTFVHDFVHRRRAYSGFCGSCVRMFSINYVESVGAHRSTPPRLQIIENKRVSHAGERLLIMEFGFTPYYRHNCVRAIKYFVRRRSQWNSRRSRLPSLTSKSLANKSRAAF